MEDEWVGRGAGIGAGEVKELDATVAMAAAARDMGLRGGRGDCSDDGLGGGEGARAALLLLLLILGLGETEAEEAGDEVEEGRMMVERRDGGTGGGGARFAVVPEADVAVVVIELSIVVLGSRRVTVKSVRECICVSIREMFEDESEDVCVCVVLKDEMQR